MSNGTIYETIIEPGHHWSFVMRRGHTLTLRDNQGGTNVGMMLYNERVLAEKYNAPDTLKCQHTFQLTTGHCLYSDMGRIFCSVVADGFGGHDTVCGNSDSELVKSRWGERHYQSQSNAWTQNGFDSFLTELAKYGLNHQSLAANVNWFSRVSVDDDGVMSREATSSSGKHVTLRFELDTLVLLHTCPHPLDVSTVYPGGELTLEIAVAESIATNDVCLNHCEENRRGFRNNALYHMERFEYDD